ncbi:hypothetical protein LCGC14_1438070 [marine sediment metagenome]|uniref:Uncharacterized protein n=1 Tax=marine sediment metagenome TaxID=412755 RepID=A0A0F9K7P8_9ZZZZ
MSDSEIKGQNTIGQNVGLKATEGGILHNLPYHVVWSVKGYGKQAMATAAIAALVVRPSTISALTIYNPAGNSKHLIIERVFAHNLVTATTELGSIWLCSHPVGMTAPTGNDITIRNSTSGHGAGDSATIVDTAETVLNNGWFPWGQALLTPLDGTVPSGAVCAEVGGRIIVPPSAGLSVHVVASTASNTYTCGFHWFEVPTLELTVS